MNEGGLGNPFKGIFFLLFRDIFILKKFIKVGKETRKVGVNLIFLLEFLGLEPLFVPPFI